jgi:hypothetical protein
MSHIHMNIQQQIGPGLVLLLHNMPNNPPGGKCHRWVEEVVAALVAVGGPEPFGCPGDHYGFDVGHDRI